MNENPKELKTTLKKYKYTYKSLNPSSDDSLENILPKNHSLTTSNFSLINVVSTSQKPPEDLPNQHVYISTKQHQYRLERVPDKEVLDDFEDIIRSIKNSKFCTIFIGVLWISLFISMFVYAQILWGKSLETCKDDIIICLKEMKMKFFTILQYIALFGFIHFLIFILSFFVKSQFVKYFGISLSVMGFGFRAWNSQGFSAEDHSLANIVISFSVIVVGFLLIGLISLTIKIFKKKFFYGIAWLSFFILLGQYIYWERVVNSCVHLNDSLDDRVKYSEEGGMCKWFQPKRCWAYTIDGIFKPLYFGKDTCEKIDTTDLSHHYQV